MTKEEQDAFRDEERKRGLEHIENMLGLSVEYAVGVIVDVDDLLGKKTKAVFLGIMINEHDDVCFVAREQNVKFAQAWHYSRLLGRSRG